MKPKHVHIIGICGVLSSAIASAFHERGWKVTGSDKGFYPPTSSHLDELGVPYYAGWHPEKMVAEGIPDFIIVATASGSQNPETLYALEHNIPLVSYTEVLRDYFVGKNSIVCVGTWGKTTTSTLLSFILEKAGLDPSYMFGGISLSQKLSAKISKDEQKTWSVLEGDEYKSGPKDPRAKFFYYNPTHLILSAIFWDHADLYPTPEDYINAFKKILVETVGRNKQLGLSEFDIAKRILICGDHTILTTLAQENGIPHTTYGKSADNHYRYENLTETKDGISFDIVNGTNKYSVTSPMLGNYNAENITSCFAMAHLIGIPTETILKTIAQFEGLKRRLEKRLVSDITVIDTHAPTPDKVEAGLSVLRRIYSGKIVAIFEPNIGGRQRGSAFKYDNAFQKADLVLIPRLTKLKVDKDATEAPLEAAELAEVISKTHPSVFVIENDDELVRRALSETKKDDLIVFLGSHGFRGMIEQTIYLRPQYQSK